MEKAVLPKGEFGFFFSWNGGAMDTICLHDIRVKCRIGVEEKERRRKQTIVINIRLKCDLRRPGSSDDLSDTVDYGSLYRSILHETLRNRKQLLEGLAERLAVLCLDFSPLVESVTISVRKPRILRFADGASVEITRP